MSDKAAGAAGGACTQLLHLHAGPAYQPKVFVALFLASASMGLQRFANLANYIVML